MPRSQQGLEHYKDERDTDVESRQGLLSNKDFRIDVASPELPSKPRRWMVMLTLFNLLLFTATTVLLLTNKWHVGQMRLSMNAALRETSIYSPILNTMEINMVETKMNGSVWRTLDTPWNGEPDDAVKEAVWDDFNFIQVFPISRKEIVKMGQDPLIAATFDEAHWNMGVDKYIGAMDIFHQIHCLNYIRKKALLGSTEGDRVNGTARLHTIHCVDMLMQHLLCTGDTGVLTYNWYEGIRLPQPNFSVNRKCIDWRQLVEYRDTHAAPSELWESYEKPVGAHVVQKGEV